MQALRTSSLRTLGSSLAYGRRAVARPMSALAATADGTDEPTILNGRELSKSIRGEIRKAAKALKDETGAPPHLAIVTVGDRPPAEAMRRKLFASGPGEQSWWDKVSGAKDAGFDVTHVKLPADAPVEAVKRALAQQSRRPEVNGVMLELPLPSHLTKHRQELWGAIDSDKDVDGMTLHNAGRLFDLASGISEAQAGSTGLLPDLRVNLPTTPLGALEYALACGVTIKPGANVVVVGRSKLVGLPLAALMLARNATVTITHSRTPEDRLVELCRDADVIVATAGIPGQIKPEWVKKGAAVMNVGTTFRPETKELVPDVDPRVKQVASFVSPVPIFDPQGKLGPSGGGPMTLPMLLHSTLANATRQAKARKEKEAKGSRADTPALSAQELSKALEGGLKGRGWAVSSDGKTLSKTFVTADFGEAVRLVNDIKAVAEGMNHHPALHLTEYRQLTVELSSGLPCGQPGSGGARRLTAFDVKLADAIDQLPYAPHQK